MLFGLWRVGRPQATCPHRSLDQRHCVRSQVPRAQPGSLPPSSQLASGFREGLPFLCLLGSSSVAPGQHQARGLGQESAPQASMVRVQALEGHPGLGEAVGWQVRLCAHVLRVRVRYCVCPGGPGRGPRRSRQGPGTGTSMGITRRAENSFGQGLCRPSFLLSPPQQGPHPHSLLLSHLPHASDFWVMPSWLRPRWESRRNARYWETPGNSA